MNKAATRPTPTRSPVKKPGVSQRMPREFVFSDAGRKFLDPKSEPKGKRK